MPVFWLALLSAPAQGQSINLGNGSVVVADLHVIPAAAGIETWIDAATFPNGDLLVADMFTGHLIRVDESGNRRWKTGGLGEGPGEFERLYRIGVSPSGLVVAFDLERSDLSFFSDDGEFVDRKRLEVFFRQVDSVVMPTDQLIFVSGTTPPGSEQADHAIHSFDRDARHIASFGPLPKTDQREVLGYWGAGLLRVTDSGDMLYTRRLPYEIYRFSPDGQIKATTLVDVPTVGRPEDRYEITRGVGYRVQRTDATITYPIASIDVGDSLYLSSRHEGDKRFLTLVTTGGAVLEDIQLERGQGILVDGSVGQEVVWFSDSSSGFAKTLLVGRLIVP
jgi:hypothetical protein